MQHIQSGSAERELRNDGIFECPVSDVHLNTTRHGPQCHVKPPIRVTIEHPYPTQ